MARNQLLTQAANASLALCAVVVTVLLIRKELRPTQSQLTPTRHNFFLDSVPANPAYFEGGHRLGAVDVAPALVIFSDYECPACKALHEQLQKRRRSGALNLPVSYRHWPLARHQSAERAAIASECAAAQGRFAQMHDSLFARQRDLATLALDDLAAQAGVGDIDAFRRCTKSDSAAKFVKREASVAASINSRGTPTVLVRGGKAFVGVPPERVLDSLLSALAMKR
jgi:protein-disulfide isomerase